MRTLLTVALGLALGLGLNLPLALSDLGRLGTWALPLEIVSAVAMVALVPALWRKWPVRVLAAVLAWLIVFRAADGALYHVMGRPITLVFDLPLALSLIEIGREVVGLPATLALAAVPLLPLLAVGGLAALFLRRAAALPAARIVAPALAVVASLLALGGAVTPSDHRTLPLVSVHGLHQVLDQMRRVGSAKVAEERWASADSADPAASLAAPELLSGLAGTDVVLLFIESYGRTAIEGEPFASVVQSRLAGMERSFAGRGLATASGWLRSPTVGGQSWLAHATLGSGVLTDDEAGHAVYMRRAHADLAHLFARSGHRTVLAAPGLVRAYPEGHERLGFDAVYTAADLAYAGPRFDWVTMPDQFTLAAVERHELPPLATGRLPVFLQAVLIGSHAPFTPLPSLVPEWQAIGDGRIFGDLPRTGDPATRLWRDPPRLRLAYRDSIDVVLASIEAYARQATGGRSLLILVGDHEPAAIVTGDEQARTVPMHLVASDPALLQPFLAWGFTPGMRPGAAAPVHPMEAFRNRLVEGFSGPPAMPAREMAGTGDGGGG